MNGMVVPIFANLSRSGWIRHTSARLQRIGSSWLLVLAAAIGVLGVRFALLQEPWNSDDMVYYQSAQLFSEGRHILQIGLAKSSLALPLRVGLIAPVALAIWLFGFGWQSYYMWPLAFSMVGGIGVAVVAKKALPLWAAVAAVALHIVLPFEIRHGTVLFTDLPAAALSLVAIVVLAEMVTRAESRFRGSFLLASLAALVLFWAYLMRSNQPVFVVPAVVVLALRRRGLGALAAAAALFLALVLLEQLWYIHLGGSFGYRWVSVADAQAYWIQFYPKFDVLGYLVRPFAFALGQHGVVGLMFVILAVPAHVHVLLSSREAVLKAVVAAGLSAFLLFNYYVFDVQDGKLIAFVSQHRILQPFYYSSIVAIPSAAGAGWKHFQRLVRSRRWRQFTLVAAVLAFVFVLVDFLVDSYSPRSQVNFALNPYRRVSDVVSRLLASDPSVVVAGTPQALRTVRLFSEVEGGHDSRWRALPYTSIARELEASTINVLVRDRIREQNDVRFAHERISLQNRQSIQLIEEFLLARYSLAYRDERFAVFSLSEHEGSPEVFGCAGKGSSTNGWKSGSTYPKDAAVDVQNSVVRFMLGRKHAYVMSSKMVGLYAPPLEREAFALDPENTYFVRLTLEAPNPAQANPSIWFLEYDGEGKRTKASKASVQDGNSTLWVTPAPNSRYYALGIRVSGDGDVRILTCSIAAVPHRGLPID